MQKFYLFTILLLSILLAACSGAGNPPVLESTAVPPTEGRAAQSAPPTTAPAVEETASPVDTANADLEALTATAWMWVGFTDPIQQFSVDNPENYTLSFQDDGTLNIKADCNNATGGYTVDGSSIKIEVGPMTKAACPPESLSDQFIEHLGYAAIYFFEDGNLYIDLFADGGTLEFAPAAEVAEADVEAPGAARPEALAETLGNLSYSGLFPDQPITLTDGYYYYSEGGTGTPSVHLIDRQIVLGDLNEDGGQDAVILLEDDSEGTGRFTFLVAVLNLLTDPMPVEAIMLGDRIGVKSLVVDGTQVVADIVAQGPGDADCCASWNVQVVYSLEDGRLVEQSRTELNRISLDDLDSTRWRLVDLNLDQEPVLPETEITLHFDDGQISGFAGCNDYSGTVSSGEYGLNSLEVSPIAATQSLCPDPVSAQENTYLTRLGSAESWHYDYGHLSLVYKLEEDVFGELQFTPQEENMTNTNQIKPNAVTELEAAYGAPSQAGFGSAVFFEQLQPTDDLEMAALAKYKYFVGELWERYGEDAWMGPWKEVYARQSGGQADIVAELRSIQDSEAAISVPMILDNIEGADKARIALSSAYDDPEITDLLVFSLGDGGAMSGLLIAGRDIETGEAIFLVFLLD